MARPSPETYPSTTVKPPAFDAFWRAIIAETDAIPLDPVFEPVPLRSTAAVDVYDVRFTSLDHLRIAAWYCRPAGHPGPLPGLLIVPGYVSEPLLPKAWAAQGYATLSLAPRGKLRSNAQFNPGYPGLLTHNLTDPHTYGYRGFYMDAYRALDVLFSRPEVDRQRVGVHGSSQGGALTLLVAALRPETTCGAAGAPYLCGHLDAAALTHSYPYQEINDYLRLYPEREAAARATTNLYDIINFADRITCPMLINIGLEDDVCPPETGYALVRQMTSCRVDLHAYPQCAHDAGSGVGHARLVSQFLADHLRPSLQAASPAGPVPTSRAESVVLVGRPADELQPASVSSSASPAGPSVPTGARPAGFDAYWTRLEAELASLPAAATVDPLPMRSTEFADGYAVNLTSIGPYRLFAYYSVPHGPGPFPVIYHAPGYASVVQVPPYEERRRHIVLSLCARGQRLSDRPFSAAFPGLLTHGIDDPAHTIYRGIMADTLRALDFLMSRAEVDAQRIAIVGNDLALLAAARRPGVAAVVMSGPLFYGAADLIPATSAYPWEEVNDYTRTYPERTPAVYRTLAYFDPLHHAERVQAAVYVPHEGPGGWLTRDRLAPLMAALPNGATGYQLTGQGWTDRGAQETWLAQRLHHA